MTNNCGFRVYKKNNFNFHIKEGIPFDMHERFAKTRYKTILKDILINSAFILFIYCTFVYLEDYFAILCIIYIFYSIVKLGMHIYFDLNEIQQNYIPQISTFPIYTILLPMYKEKKLVIDQLIKNIDNIHYPKTSLDIKILLEDDDIDAMEHIMDKNLGAQYEIIVLNNSLKTKGYALNAAIPFIKGEYLTIYDAEDKPDYNQILHTLELFREDPDLAVIQCRLNFCNRVNWISKHIAQEYDYVFCMRNVLMSQKLNLLLLGGTSNHIKVSALKQCNGWDASNMTEDAELGLLMSVNGYKTTTLSSCTMEEAVTTSIAWIRQRSRWLKGYIQTYQGYFMYIIAQTPWREIKKRAYLHMFINIYYIIMLIMPIMLLLNIIKVIFSISIEHSSSFETYIVAVILIPFIAECFSSAIVSNNNEKALYRAIIFIPSSIVLGLTKMLYYGLYIAAFNKAIFEILFDRRYWDKTDHSGIHAG